MTCCYMNRVCSQYTAPQIVRNMLFSYLRIKIPTFNENCALPLSYDFRLTHRLWEFSGILVESSGVDRGIWVF